VWGPHDESTAPSLFDELLRELRSRHYSRRTQRAYLGWLKRFIAFHGQLHPGELGAPQLGTFLDQLLQQGASKSSHQQALCALQFFYQKVLRVDAPIVEGLRRPRHEHPLLVRDGKGHKDRVTMSRRDSADPSVSTW